MAQVRVGQTEGPASPELNPRHNTHVAWLYSVSTRSHVKVNSVAKAIQGASQSPRSRGCCLKALCSRLMKWAKSTMKQPSDRPALDGRNIVLPGNHRIWTQCLGGKLPHSPKHPHSDIPRRSEFWLFVSGSPEILQMARQLKQGPDAATIGGLGPNLFLILKKCGTTMSWVLICSLFRFSLISYPTFIYIYIYIYISVH